MATKLIKLEDGTLVEVEIPEGQPVQISSRFAERVDTTFEKVKPLLINTCKPIIEACNELSQNVTIEQVEVQLGLTFEGEGNIYITKAKAGANLTVKLLIKPKQRSQ
ncbi:MAG: hypothetical protein HY785_21870 [Oscillatoriophycideae cyanobacterium NC_groundwater_1537_Pr4_S-0.65um_50_18]|nr:hypothetical protein [Oscillatoriophycideae cyanobacterium NC_groundwater_1537_Pr4_S-0.65um_50_18]